MLAAGPSFALFLDELLAGFHGVVVDADNVDLRLAVAETPSDGTAVRVGGGAGYARCLMTSYHIVYLPGVYYALDVAVEDIVGQGMGGEPLHYGVGGLVFEAIASVDEPVDFYRSKLRKAGEEVCESGVFKRHDKLVEVDESYPAGVESVAGEAVVIGGELAPVAGEILVFHLSGVDVGLKHAPGVVSALVVVDIKLLHALADMPVNPLLEIFAFVLRDGAHSEVIGGRSVVDGYLPA